MFTLIFILSLIFSIWRINQRNNEDNDGESMSFEGKDSLIIMGFFILTFLLNFIFKTFIPHLYLIASLVSLLPDLILLSVVNAHREKQIKTRQEVIKDIYEKLADIIGRIDEEDMDFNDLPFEYKINEKKNTVDEITIDTSLDVKVSDDTITTTTYSLNKQFNQFQWIGEENPQERELKFIGLPKPPEIAKFPGSDYHAFSYVPLGVSGQGEIGWYKTKDKRGVGFSSYRNDDGKQIGTVDVQTAPQMLVGGTSGGGKAIYINQEIEIIDD